MNNSEDLIIIIGGSGRIGSNFCLYALKTTNYKILNIDPSENIEIQSNKKWEGRYLNIPILINDLDSAKTILNTVKTNFKDTKINSIINLSRVKISETDNFLISEKDVIDNINGQIIGLNFLINLIFNENKKRDFSIIHFGSLNSKLVSHQSVLYHYLKGAIESASKSLAYKLANYNIRSNVVICGLVKDPEFELTNKQKKLEEISIPLSSGPPTINDVAHLILFLLSPSSRAITGTSIIIDAGMSLPDSYTVLSSLDSFN